MKVTHKVKYNKLPQIESRISHLNGRTVTVGANWANSWLAGIHEYGCNITVTPKMRVFLHRQGFHLHKNTKTIRIPERSFFRTTHDKEADRILKQTELALGAYIDGSMSLDKLLDTYGEQMATAVKKTIRDIETPPNHPFTIEQKGSSNPLVDTGALKDSIMWEKE